MPAYSYHHVDVFTDTPFGGNPLAVFPYAEGLSTAQMQSIARELNLSESAFVLPPKDKDNNAHVSIFTPFVELPMAGHPTVGTAFVLQREGLIPSSGAVRFEEGIGVVKVDLQTDDSGVLRIFMTQPEPRFKEEFTDRAALAAMLSLEPDDLMAAYPAQVVTSGVPFLYIPLKDLDAVKHVRVRLDIWENILKDFSTKNIFVFTLETALPTSGVHSRMFAPAMGIAEDPATGAACGPLGAYLVKHGLVLGSEPIINEQGFEMGRPSLIHIRVIAEGDDITAVQVGGSSVYMGTGTLHIDG